jgi:hypothetical protein
VGNAPSVSATAAPSAAYLNLFDMVEQLLLAVAALRVAAIITLGQRCRHATGRLACG